MGSTYAWCPSHSSSALQRDGTCVVCVFQAKLHAAEVERDISNEAIEICRQRAQTAEQLLERLREALEPYAVTALGDGVTDDAPAFQFAADRGWPVVKWDGGNRARKALSDPNEESSG